MIRSRAELKAIFRQGAKPPATEFHNWMDSYIHIGDVPASVIQNQITVAQAANFWIDGMGIMRDLSVVQNGFFQGNLLRVGNHPSYPAYSGIVSKSASGFIIGAVSELFIEGNRLYMSTPNTVVLNKSVLGPVPAVEIRGGLLQLASSITDYAPIVGGAFFNSATHQYRVCPNGIWTNLLTGDSPAVLTGPVQSHTSGTAVTMQNNARVLVVNPAAKIAGLTITLPATPADGQEVLVCFGGQITAGQVVDKLSLAGNTGHTVLPAVANHLVSAGDSYQFKYISAAQAWFNIGTRQHNYSGQIKATYTNLSITNFTVGVAKAFPIHTAPGTLVAEPVTTFPYGSAKTYDPAMYVAGNNPAVTARMKEHNRPGQTNLWRMNASYEGKAINNNGSVLARLRNPDSGFITSDIDTLPSGQTSGTLTFLIATVADSASLADGRGYVIEAITSFSDNNLSIKINDITRINIPVENV